MHKFKNHIFLLAFIYLSACCGIAAGNSITEQSNKYHFEKFLGSITSFPYYAPLKQQEHLKMNYLKLKVGMAKDEVLNILPSPNAEFFSYTEKGKEKIFKKSSLAYYLSRKEHRFASDDDAVLFLHFNNLEQLYWSIPNNIEGLSSLGNPAGAR
jgi:hypothetical protein